MPISLLARTPGTTSDSPAVSRAEEAGVVAAARDGDAAAFRRLYQSHVGMVYALCLRLAGNRTWAEELTQDVFVQVWERLGQFRGQSAFGTWLYRVAVNTTLMALRRSRRRSQRFDPARELEAVPDPVRPDRDARVDLEEAVGLLPPACRAVFVLFDVEGWPHAEIADQLGIAEGTSKAHLFRARRLLRELLTR